MNEHLYAYLNEWGKVNHVSFNVEHFSDCHVLSVTHHLPNDMVSWTYRVYPHKGGAFDLQPLYDETVRRFIELAEMFWTAIPKQPCGLLGYEVVA